MYLFWYTLLRCRQKVPWRNCASLSWICEQEVRCLYCFCTIFDTRQSDYSPIFEPTKWQFVLVCQVLPWCFVQCLPYTFVIGEIKEGGATQCLFTNLVNRQVDHLHKQAWAVRAPREREPNITCPRVNECFGGYSIDENKDFKSRYVLALCWKPLRSIKFNALPSIRN